MSDGFEDGPDDFASPHNGKFEVRELRLRLPPAVVQALKAQAQAEGLTVNALVSRYIDQGFKADGRLGVFELSKGLHDYLKRKGGRQ
ncbi:hypothetical protein JHC09_11090 [Devosia sp. MC532]|uniref:hypothetical protein n=1 Tax=Devosia sp. MC532 TaxID=2799788 RepID=UPI0018F3CB49|nr:hypothetical protein [Devosia sp. MC532]MBJ7578426.1 hypothetical protein [Devosia sp. MC532]